MSIALVTHPEYSFPFPGKHRFPMEKFRLLHQYLKEAGIACSANTFRPGRAKLELLSQAHCPEYLARFIHNRMDKQETRRLGLPWSPALVKRTLISPNGTFLAANLALEHGVACHLAGGTHHAHFDYGSGFCVLNDLAITAKALLQHADLKGLDNQSIIIFDCDVHQGDGTATMLANETRAFTCSLHCEKNFPARKAQSDLDINLPHNMGDQAYLDVLERTLKQLLEERPPTLFIYDAGVDIYQHDPLGLLNISLEGIRARDHMVLKTCRDRGIPIVTVIGGGYDDNRVALAKRHSIVVEEAHRLFA